MKIIDLTQTLSEKTPVAPVKTCFTRIVQARYEHMYRIDDINLCTGIGTHMDAPLHFDPNGCAIDEIPLEKCHGDACVLHLKDKVGDNIDYGVSAEDVLAFEKEHGKVPKGSHFLVHTGWDRFWDTDKFCPTNAEGGCNFPGILEDAAKLLFERGVTSVGIDSMGIDQGINPKFPAHVVFLKNNILLTENLANLEKVPPTGAKIWMFPLKIEGAPEAPIRAVAIL
ncbi:MAG: Isatin hydrolase [Chlamydiia bacterium]|nr:Isatin hydrolase [Chlamydiia bacterium]